MFFFAHFSKKIVEFQKLAHLLQMKGNKFLYNVKTHWISMLFSMKWVYSKFCPFIVKMHDESVKFDVVGKNLSSMSDVEVILG
jgi:5-methylcytosine-specific restriction endonuclease McrBC regulatory subunit McrC